MTPAEFRSIRKELGLSARRMADALGLKEPRTIRRYESGEIEISGPVVKLSRIILEGMRGVRRAVAELGPPQSVALASAETKLLRRANLAIADLLRRAGIEVEIVPVAVKGRGTMERAAAAARAAGKRGPRD